MRIGELAARTGVSPRALRHYESQKLIESVRLANGYRDYPAASLQRVLWIRELLDCGFSTRQIHGLLDYLHDSDPGSASFRACLQQHLDKLSALDELLALLQERRERLFRRVAHYAGPPASGIDQQRVDPHEATTHRIATQQTQGVRNG